MIERSSQMETFGQSLSHEDVSQCISSLFENRTSKTIRIGIGTGIVGHVVCSGEPFSCADAYDCDKFNPAVDRSSGYRTRQILCVPMLSTSSGKNKVIGAIQVVNRCDHEGVDRAAPFNGDEQQLLMTLGPCLSSAFNKSLQ